MAHRSLARGVRYRAASAVATGVIALVLGSAAGAAALSTGTLEVRSGTSVVASGSATVFRGWSAAAGGNLHSASFTVRDRSASDGRAAYGQITGSHQQQVWRAYPGGKSLLVMTTVADGSAQTSRTTSTLTEGVSVRASANNTGIWSTHAKICVDIAWAPDACTGTTF
ncbi:hypothetical protein [Cellulomonas olei]|uniref:hypothetical protein n=1 Tax=Cellulomonas sp. P4 TaxID=3142533 RepID=UPI0031BAC690